MSGRRAVPAFAGRQKIMKYSNRALKMFFIMVVCMSVITEGVIVAGGPEILYLILMWIPAISAIVAGNIILKKRNDEDNND